MTYLEPITNKKPSSFTKVVSSRPRGLDDASDIIALAMETLGRRLGAARALYAELDLSLKTYFIEQEWCVLEVSSVAGETWTLKDFGPMAIDLLQDKVVVVEDVDRDPYVSGHLEAYTDISMMSHITVPFFEHGQLAAVLAVHDIRPRK